MAEVARRVVDGPVEYAWPLHWTPSLTLGRYAVVAQAPGERDDVAEDYAINLPHRGVVLRGARRATAVVDAGTAVLWARGAEHRYDQPVGGGHSGVYLRVTPSLARSLWREVAPAGRPETAWSREAPVAAAVRRRWVAAWRTVQAGVTDAELYELGLGLAEDAVRRVWGAPRAAPLSPVARRRVRAVRVRLASDPGARVGLDVLAADVGWSRFQLARAFRQATGHTVGQHLAELRLVRALDALRDPSWDLTALALHLGFASHSHFTSRFRARFGATPSAWRALAARR